MKLTLLNVHPLLTDRVRLSIMGILASSDKPLSFNELLEGLQMTKGNLSSHMRKLEEEKFIQVEKQFIDRKPRTTFECTQKGRVELQQYLKNVEALIAATKK